MKSGIFLFDLDSKQKDALEDIFAGSTGGGSGPLVETALRPYVTTPLNPNPDEVKRYQARINEPEFFFLNNPQYKRVPAGGV